ncbi:P-loop containing nucleoside triphosphate hydrolase protein [Lipomyces tetrasporus]|uniref:P-loop containing nucleoside triphosphate hydrolase protein n=1 Tax=Lipomyces tetrasporus TaxID=54092 RepID=A0AAD7QZJ1_9ASCO|nr:P-loop containing nucleoside triphosphate hydrolase protein [Lipomyces tetrasporus]KAJ8103746.1 P-loop containing nucleoside triphosphate hydrolase protein [Lipomyces tetrasporus]
MPSSPMNDEKTPLQSDIVSDGAVGAISSNSSSRRSFFSFRRRTQSYSGSAKSYAAVDRPAYSDEFTSLPENEAKVLRDQVAVPAAATSYFTLYRYANKRDRFILLIGVVSALLEGVLKPLMSLLFGSVSEAFTNYDPRGATYSSTPSYAKDTLYNITYSGNYNGTDEHTLYDGLSQQDYYDTISRLSLYLVFLGIADIVLSHIKTFIFIDRGEVLSARIREHYLAATLKQNIGYFDKVGSGEITSRITSDTVLVQEAISEKISFIIANSSTFFVALVIAFTQSYILTFIMLSILVSIIVSTGIASAYMVKCLKKSQDGYAVGGTLAEEVIGSVRNVQAFGIQEIMVHAYDNFLKVSEYWGIWAGIATGLMNGSMYLCSFSTDALAYWQGVRLYSEYQATLGNIITIIFAVFQGAYAFAQISPYLSSITTGMAAASKIFATIDRVSAIDSSNETGIKLNEVEGNIEFAKVKFIYPSRPNVTVLNDFSLSIPAGKTVALVGSSGSGKSTIVSLIERFYNPVCGDVLLDGHNIRDLNIRWLRQKIAVVQQEPTLFACSIYENIAHGLVGSEYECSSPIEKRALIIEACKQANAWTFIEKLPEGLDTSVGERGFLMSGGQKQRIAIARAIVSNPKILLLDEATSALDTKSEGIVQEALDRASKNRTTIVIAHRLSTVKDADCIVVMRRGHILEMGTHNDLLAKNGEYCELVKAQQIETLKENEKKQLETANKSRPDDSDTEEGFNEKMIELSDYQHERALDLARTMTRKSMGTLSRASDIEVQDDNVPSFSEALKFIYDLSRPEMSYNVIGLIACFFNGMGYPALGLLWGTNLQAFGDIMDRYELRVYISRMAGFLFLLACSLGISNTVTGAAFGHSSSLLVRRIRRLSFSQMLRQEVAFFDRDENTVGSLTGTLSRDAQAVEGLGGITLGKFIDAFVTVIGSSIVSIALAWKLGLVVTCGVPVLMGSGFYRFYLLTEFESRVKKENERTSTYACEATSAIRTVVALTRESDVWETYHSNLNEIIRRNRPASMRSAFFYGLTQAQVFFIMALATWYGGQLLGTGEYNLFQFYLVFLSIIFGAETAGVVFSFAPDVGKAVQAAKNIKMLLERVPDIDPWSEEGKVPQNVRGDIEFRDVHFRYPTRPEVPVLRGLNLKIQNGQYVALVGASGCGKSTTISLIEEFYRPNAGAVLLDGQDISELNINAYREQIALVSQEPTLYAGSIKYNVQLGSPTAVTDDQVIDVCKQANIHDFVMSLPDGYDTLCGSKGALLSGGQKQRIAIARALIRKPKILLLDEATSALDSESEKVVQTALDAAAQGRTTIAVAHRLSTIQNADVIYVFEAGRVCEAGKHQDLLAKNGRYYELVHLQALEESS